MSHQSSGAVTAVRGAGDALEAPKWSCAFGGALNAATNVDRVIPITHSGPGCGQNQNYRSYSAGSQGSGYIGGCVTPSSNLGEREVVFGGEDRLREQLAATLELMDGDLYVVLTGCIPAMIGDDVESVVRELSTPRKPIITVETAGFSGSTYFGYEQFLKAVATQLLKKPRKKVAHSVNLLGVVPYQNLFWRGDLTEITRLLSRIGVTANQIFGDSIGIESLKRIPSASLNVVLSPWVGVESAEVFEEQFGTPFVVAPLPTGLGDTAAFLRSIGAALGIDEIEVEAVIADEEARAVRRLDLAAELTSQFSSALPFAIVADTTEAVALTRYLANEIGLTPTLVVVTDAPPQEAQAPIAELVTGLGSGLDPRIVFASDAYDIDQALKGEHFSLLLASSQERYLASDLGIGYVGVAYPLNNQLVITRSYAGYEGAITFLEDVMSVFFAPV